MENAKPRNRAAWFLRPWAIAAGLGLFVVVAGLALLLLPQFLLSYWAPDLTARQIADRVPATVQLVLFTLGGLIASVGVALSLSRHREELEASKREQASLELEWVKERTRTSEFEELRRVEAERGLRDRFVSATELLTSSEWILRAAGAHALAAVADDWLQLDRQDEAQVVADVICGYLRAPIDPGDRDEEIGVRQGVASSLRNRLRSPVYAQGWRELTFDFSRLILNFELNLSGVHLRGSGQMRWDGVEVEGDGRLRLEGADLSGSSLMSFRHIHARKGGVIDFRELTLSDRARVSFFDAVLSEGSSLNLDYSRLFDHGQVSLVDLVLDRRGQVLMSGSKFRGAGKLLVHTLAIGATSSFAAVGTEMSEDAALSITEAKLGGNLWLSGSRLEQRAEILMKDVSGLPNSRVDLNGLGVFDRATFRMQESAISGQQEIEYSGLRVGAQGVLAFGSVQILPDGYQVADHKPFSPEGAKFVQSFTPEGAETAAFGEKLGDSVVPDASQLRF